MEGRHRGSAWAVMADGESDSELEIGVVVNTPRVYIFERIQRETIKSGDTKVWTLRRFRVKMTGYACHLAAASVVADQSESRAYCPVGNF